MPPIFAEQPWYLADDALCLEDERPLADPFIATPADHEYQLIHAFDGVRREVVAQRVPLENQLRRRRLLEDAVALAVAYHGGSILAGTLFAFWDGAGVEVIRAPQGPVSKMARTGNRNGSKRKAQAV